jgi:hypothetical protein
MGTTIDNNLVKTNTGMSQGDTRSICPLTGRGHDWGQAGDAELLRLPTEFDMGGGGPEYFDAGRTWSSVNDFLFLDNGLRV